MSRMRVGALFAGVGGVELGLSGVLDTELAWVSEWEPPSRSTPRPTQAAAHVLAHHWPNVPNLGDVTAIDWSMVEPVDIITGGTPCQDLSNAGKRAGMVVGTRSGLWASMREAIAVLHPSLVLWENVRGALSARASSEVEREPGRLGNGQRRPALRALGRVLGDLASLGYDAAWVGLRAADVGAPHGRFRVFVLGWPAGRAPALTLRPAGRAPALLPSPAVNDMGADKSIEWWDEWTARLKAEHRNGNGHGPSLSVEALRLLPTPRATRGGSSTETNALLPTPTSSDRNGAGEHGDGGADLRTAVSLLPTPRATDGTKGGPNQRGSSGDLMLPSAVLLPTPTTAPITGNGHARNLGSEVSQFGIYTAAVRRWEALTRPAPSPTEPTGRGGAQRLSPRFVEWLMGLPDGHVIDVPGISRNDMLKALGNGAVPQQVDAAMRWLVGIMASEAVA